MKATELERLAQELVDNLNHNVVNQVPSDKQVKHRERGQGDAETCLEAAGREPAVTRFQPNVDAGGPSRSCRA
jgi:hypothetical protein